MRRYPKGGMDDTLALEWGDCKFPPKTPLDRSQVRHRLHLAEYLCRQRATGYYAKRHIFWTSAPLIALLSIFSSVYCFFRLVRCLDSLD